MRFFLISVLALLLAVLSSCESEDDNYSGVGKLIADRNKMRHRLAGEAGDNTNDKGNIGSSNQRNDFGAGDATEKAASKPQLSTNVLAEKKIVIMDTASGKPLGQGVAYIDQQGNIVKIKLAH
nr:hypothetical protein [uncultured Desulfobacter sp.]